MRTKTGYLFMDTLKKKFTKKALSTDEQIEMLSARGLIIPDRAITFQCLSTVSYYRLSAYFKPFQIHSENDHYFKPNITFDRIWKIYVFDRELRLHISDALERIEIALRTALSDVMSIKYGNLWYLSKEPFCKEWVSKNKNGISRHDYFKKEVDGLCADKREEFLAHYYHRYDDPQYPPSWMLMECLSFGKITSLFRNLATLQDKKSISDIFGYHPRVVESTLEPLRYTRNLCAHHSRIWNRWFLYTPKHLKAFGSLVPPSNSLHMQAFIIHKLNESISPNSGWRNNMRMLFSKYSDYVPFELMGFLQDWENDPFWAT